MEQKIDFSRQFAYIDKPNLKGFRGSSMAEHAAVNRRVVGSSPTRGAKNPDQQ
jgi:hypothetical protein